MSKKRIKRRVKYRIKRKPLLLLIAIFFLLIVSYNKISKNANEKDVIKEKNHTSITLSFAGDVTMGNYMGSTGIETFNGEFERQNRDYSYFLKNVKSIFENDDITIVNLEGPLTTSTVGNTEKQFAFKGDPSYAKILKEGNVEAVGIANNHSLDYFEKGLEDTKNVLDNNRIKYSGMGEKAIIESKGIKVGLLAYNGWESNYNDKYLEGIKKDIDQLKKEADLVTVYFHWGVEKENYPTQVQKDFAHFSIDNGADLVVGSHPHVLQGIESYQNKDGETKMIAYSLSNFCFGGNKNPSDKDSMIYQQTFNFEDGKLIDSEEPNIIPCSISSSKIRNNYQPTPLLGAEANRVMNRIKAYSNNL
ncbi:CapA family protein [Metaclostridioides mangenotii]|uniref:Poly-gamma-glutamate synthesis protein (Capsule biosynthesis protein) n=1 Tax=Metaclostridioides mangenotii TaxID=1540 RepID=A0ABS4ECV6_9FIRM|nr:CapA family protein [Clostridioides mangenotii]MBP1855726.1 poly-gamma-glutamate synthesis protein (capsule biosynthesis protein) [Clostridioides mangenotii]